jgi:hypothetical protein
MEDHLFHTNDALSRPRGKFVNSFPAALTASLFIQAGATAFLAGHLIIGGELSSLGAAILTGRLKAAGILSKERLNKFAMAVLVLAFGFELFNLYFHFRGSASADYALEHAAGIGSGKYRGVILWTPAKPPAVLVAPLPESGRGLNTRNNPLVIPFDGVYWFYKFPDRKPPKDSYSTRGSPSATAFRSSDSLPLQMEARQNFPNLLDMSCCSRIAVEIVNADRAPGTVSLELILTNLRLPGDPAQSLGRLPVTSTPQWLTGSEVRSVPEVLSFAIPPNPRIRKFDSATVRFIREGRRNLSSAKIAIQQFTLVPRGR